MTNVEKVKFLRGTTGSGLMECTNAIKYGKGDLKVAVAYLNANSLAVATPGLSFDERVKHFLMKG